MSNLFHFLKSSFFLREPTFIRINLFLMRDLIEKLFPVWKKYFVLFNSSHVCWWNLNSYLIALMPFNVWSCSNPSPRNKGNYSLRLNASRAFKQEVVKMLFFSRLSLFYWQNIFMIKHVKHISLNFSVWNHPWFILVSLHIINKMGCYSYGPLPPVDDMDFT